ncbi:ABC transporter permease [Antrihabitans sp. YC2-6]|uniref:MlaE family ABC transporter permease n=1 Tax=Antrihabitans sp. YC2-6 TaxID=2799498 RepID=UPI0018F5CE60|nr:ABC transporter permease [Antrihabitans sp. YC2-6]MBJ8344665.1 ABC transporter permease [Antrihabitans sp. YC2-6]
MPAISTALMKPLGAMGEFFALSADAFRGMAVWPFQWREFLDQCWFIVRVSLVPTLLVALPFTALISFTFNILAAEFGASDVAGAGATLGAVTQVGPVVTVLVVAGAGATAICADLGSRTIREEIDAMEVLGIDPIVRLVSPRVLASMLVALLLNALVCAIGIVGSFVFSVFFQNVTPGAFVDGIPLLTGLPELVISEVKAGAFGLIAALIACYRGLTVKGGPKSVGQAVNETVVYAFMALFVVNVVMTAIGIKMTAGR